MYSIYLEYHFSRTGSTAFLVFLPSLFFSFPFSFSFSCDSVLLPFSLVPLSLSFLSLFLSFLSSLPFLLRTSRTAVPFLSSPYPDLISFTLFLSFFCSFCTPCPPLLPRYFFLCCEIISRTSLPPCRCWPPSVLTPAPTLPFQSFAPFLDHRERSGHGTLLDQAMSLLLLHPLRTHHSHIASYIDTPAPAYTHGELITRTLPLPLFPPLSTCYFLILWHDDMYMMIFFSTRATFAFLHPRNDLGAVLRYG